MPILFLAPAVVPAAQAISGWMIALYVSSGVAGGVTIAGGSWLLFSRSNSKIVRSHLELLDSQHKVTEERIELASLSLNILRQSVSGLAEEIELETQSASTTHARLKDLSKQLAETIKQIDVVVNHLTKANLGLEKTIAELQKLSDRTSKMSKRALDRLGELNDLIHDKGAQLIVSA